MLNTTVSEMICLDELINREETPRERLASRVLSSAQDVNGVLQEHLHVVTDSTEKAALNIVERAVQVDDAISELSLHLKEAVCECAGVKEEGLQSIEALKLSLLEMGSYIQQREEDARAYDENMAAILEQTRQLSDLTIEMNRMSIKGSCLALNAAAQAARAGSGAAGFKVVADEMRGMAMDYKVMAASIDASIQAVVDRIAGDKAVLLDQQVIHADVQRLASFTQQLEAVVQLFQRYDHMNSHAFSSISDAALHAGNSIMEMIATIQFQDITRQQLGSVNNILAHVNEHFDEVLTAWDDNDALVNMQALSSSELFDQYVMDGQRQAHHRTLQGSSDHDEEGAPSAAADIELF